jgi:selenide,water dikinase
MSPKDTEQVLRRLPKFKNANLLVSMETLDDAGVYRLNSETALVQTVDIFTPIVDDPYDYGCIVAANSLSDVYAMGGIPLTVMNILGFPAKKMDHDIIAEILRGGAEKVIESGAILVGGHSMLDPELKYGMSVTGLIHPKKIITNSAAQEGDILILTKPLGIGIITMANSMSPIPETLMKKITKSMVTLNKTASEVMLKVGVHAATDVTGFGLIGHASEVARGSKVTLKISVSKLPVFEEAKAYAKENIMPGGSFTNIDYYSKFVDIDSGIPEEMRHISFDAQTSGGLLMTVPQEKAGKLLKELHNNGVKHAVIIGEAIAKQEKYILLEK